MSIPLIEFLPCEIKMHIFQFLPYWEESSYAPRAVCRSWKQLFDAIHPLMLLHNKSFHASLASVFLGEQVDKVNQALGAWMSHYIATCRTPDQASFILKNLWLTIFNTKIVCHNQEVQSYLTFLQRQRIKFYHPKSHLKIILSQGYPLALPILMAALRLHYLSLKRIPIFLRHRYPELCLTAVQQRGDALKHVPHELKTTELCFATVQQDGQALHYVPKEERTPEICLAAVQRAGSALVFVPQELRTPKIYLAAVRQNRMASSSSMP